MDFFGIRRNVFDNRHYESGNRYSKSICNSLQSQQFLVAFSREKFRNAGLRNAGSLREVNLGPPADGHFPANIGGDCFDWIHCLHAPILYGLCITAMGAMEPCYKSPDGGCAVVAVAADSIAVREGRVELPYAVRRTRPSTMSVLRQR